MAILDTFVRDLLHSLRRLRRAPVFTLTVLATLGLCIGANTAVFSVVDAALFRPLPYPEPERLSLLATRFHAHGEEAVQTGQDGAAWEAVRRGAGAAFDCAAYSDSASGVNLTVGDLPDYVQQQRVSAGFFRVLGVAPARGREFSPEEDRAGGAAVTVLSDRLWRRLFRADPAAVGGTIRLKGEPYTVIGVMPPGFASGVAADLWTPLRPSTAGEGGGSNYAILVRPRPGVGVPAAEAAVAALSAEALGSRQLPPTAAAHLALLPLQGALTLGLRGQLFLLWGAVGLVLVIGCLNVAGLLLARAAGRSREMATRAALGGGRGVILRQLLTEGLVLAFLGGAAGLACGALGIRLLGRVAADGFALPQAAELDGRVVAMTAALSLLAVLLFGLFPALRASAVDLRSMLAERAGTAGRRERWPRRLLVLGEVALSVVLLVLAGLLLRALVELRSVPPGFDGTHVAAATLSLQDARYTAAGSAARLFAASLERIGRLPDVEAAAVSLSLPYERWLNLDFRRLDGPPGSGETRLTDLDYVTPGFFAALRIPLRQGRLFTGADRQGAAPVAIVSQAFVRANFPAESPLGRHISLSGGPPCEIVGVVGDLPRSSGWGDSGPRSTLPAVFVPAAQVPAEMLQLVHTWFSPHWIVRLRQPRAGIAGEVAEAIHAVDPRLPVIRFQTLAEVAAGSLGGESFQTVLLAVLAAIALALSAVGIYGLMAAAVAERGRELGIRMALGATIAKAIEAAVLPGLLPVLAGLAAGCLIAALAGPAVRHVVWGARAFDPATLAAVAGTLLLVAAGASLLPAWRVARLDPARVLRSE